MSRTASVSDSLARRHAFPEAAPGAHLPKTQASSAGRSHHLLASSAVRIVVAVVTIFAAGITVGSVVRLEFYLHRKASNSAAWVTHDNSQQAQQTGNRLGRVIKRTQEVWSVKTETYQNHVVSNPSSDASQSVSLLSLATGKQSVAVQNVTYQPAALDRNAQNPAKPAADPQAAKGQAAQQQPNMLTAIVNSGQQQQAAQQQQGNGAVDPLQQPLQPQDLQTLEKRQQMIEEKLQKEENERLKKMENPTGIAVKFGGVQHHTHVAAAMVAALRANPGAVPLDFDWRLYLAYYPDLVAAGIVDEETAKGHYVMVGQNEHRLYKPLHITLRYTACGGLMNQHYSHLAGLALGVVLRADILVPPALSRNSFASYFSQDPTKNKVTWAAAPATSMWDVNYLTSYWKERGINITEGPANHPLPDMGRPESAFPTWLPAGYTWNQVARLDHIYLKAQDMGRLAAEALHQLALKAIALGTTERPLLLDLPCTLFMLDTTTAPHLIPEIARHFKFAPQMLSLADRVLTGIDHPHSNIGFNGLHLRMEKDAKDWAQILGGRQNLFNMYLAACRKAGFNSATPMYLASGIFTYSNHTEQQAELQQLHTISSKLYYKEMFLAKADLDALTAEQQALIDFLVLAHSNHFVGISVSTFSYFLREYRSILGLPPATTTLVDGSRVGTEQLFHKAGRVVL